MERGPIALVFVALLDLFLTGCQATNAKEKKLALDSLRTFKGEKQPNGSVISGFSANGRALLTIKFAEPRFAINTVLSRKVREDHRYAVRFAEKYVCKKGQVANVYDAKGSNHVGTEKMTVAVACNDKTNGLRLFQRG